MAAGLGFKDFVTGEVLTAADVDGYLMQGVWVFASATARDAAVTSPQEGNFAYLKDTNVTTYYTGSAWANLDTTGMTNPMTTTGDTIYSSSGSTPARLGIGSTGNVLTVAGGVPTWAAPGGAGANWSLVNSGGTSLSGTSTTVSGISGADKIMILVNAASSTSAFGGMYLRFNADSTTKYSGYGGRNSAESSYNPAAIIQPYVYTNSDSIFMGSMSSVENSSVSFYNQITGCNSSGIKVYSAASGTNTPAGSRESVMVQHGGTYTGTSTISSITVSTDTGNFDSGTVYVYTSA